MDKIPFVIFTLKAAAAKLVLIASLLNFLPANTPVPANIQEEIKGIQSDVQAIFHQDMLGTGENPIYAINPVNPNGIVASTSTVNIQDLPVVTLPLNATYRPCEGYPTGGAPMNLKC